MKETRIIYLNENDRPKNITPLGLVNYYGTKRGGYWSSLTANDQDIFSKEWLQYRLDFKENDKPITLSDSAFLPNEYQLIIVEEGANYFSLYIAGEFDQRTTGVLNSGKL
jgi:hypothetical protein